MQEVVIIDASGKEHVFPSGFDPKRAAEIVRKASPQPAAPQPSKVDTLLADNPALPWDVRGGQMIGRLIKANPVASGALGGAALAVGTGGASLPLQILAAGLGGAGGAGLAISGRQLATGKPEPAGATLSTMATQGAGQAMGQGVGGGLAKGAAWAAPRLVRGVLRPLKSVQQEHPEVVETFLKERIPIGQSAEAGNRMRASAGAARQMAADAEAAGAAPVSPRDIVREFRPIRDEVERRAANASPGAENEMREIVTRARNLRAQGPVNVTRNQELKAQAQTDANKAFRAADKGAPINDTTAKLDKAVAVGRQKAAESRVDGIADVNRRTRSLMGLESALEDAEMRTGGISGWNPANWVGAMAPGAGSKAAFSLDSASRAPLPGTGRAMLAALLSMLGGEQ